MFSTCLCLFLLLSVIIAEEVCEVQYCKDEQTCVNKNYTTIRNNCAKKKIRNLNFSGNFIDMRKINNFQTEHGIDYLDLSYNHLTEIPEKAFENLKIHNKLDLSHNEIRLINTDTFYGIENLVDGLNLSNNHISTIASESIPLVSSLDLSNNVIELIEFDAFIKCLAFKNLDLRNNSLRNITFIKQITRLEILDLSSNKLSRIDKTLFSHKFLISLNISNNQILYLDIQLASGFKFYVDIEQKNDYSITNNSSNKQTLHIDIELSSGFKFYMHIQPKIVDYEIVDDIQSSQQMCSDWSCIDFQQILDQYPYYIYGGALIAISILLFLCTLLTYFVILHQRNNSKKKLPINGEEESFCQPTDCVSDYADYNHEYEEIDEKPICEDYLVPIQKKPVPTERRREIEGR